MAKTLEEYADELRVQGYTVVENVLSGDEIVATNAVLDAIFERESDIGPQRNWHNATYKVAYMLPQKDPLFLQFCFNPRVLPLMQLLLGERCVIGSLNGLSMTPGGRGQSLHLDQPETVPNTMLYINALHTLDDFTRENGSTRVVPGSHNRPMPQGATHEAIEEEAVYLEAPAGSLIAFNGGLWHAGSQNRTDKPRRAIHAFYHRSWVRPQWDYPRSLSPEVVATMTDEQKRLFGFGARPQWYDYQTDEVKHDC
jgi:ectoine hydroxylase-related dioxygenase (phytanoyl-CoA dioxygenase family)